MKFKKFDLNKTIVSPPDTRFRINDHEISNSLKSLESYNGLLIVK